MRRRRKKNPDAGTSLAAVGGFVAGPFLANVVGFSTHSALAGMLATAGTGGFAFYRARKSSGASRVGYYGAAAGCALNALFWFVASRNLPGPGNVVATVNGQQAPATLGPASSEAPAPPQWQAFNPQAPAVPLVPGVRYRAAIDLPFGTGVLATRDRVESTAHEMGFSDVAVFEGEPSSQSGWTDPFGKIGDADLFVEATYAGAPKWLERSERIVSAWAFV